MSTNLRIARNLGLAAAVSLWLAVVTGRALEMLDWRWLWVLAPVWVALSALVLLLTGVALGSAAMRFYLTLLTWAERRRRAREILQFRRAMDSGLRELVGSRTLRFREQPANRKPRP